MSPSLRHTARPPAAATTVAAALLGLLAGCTNLSGLGGSAQMSCAAPPGVPCLSVSGVHASATAGVLPSQRGAGAPAAAAGTDAAPAAPAPQRAGPVAPVPAPQVVDDAPSLGAIRSEPTLIRIWIAPWEDADGDLHSDSYVYLQVDSGRWLIEHNRERLRRQFAPLPAAAAAPALSAATAGGPAPAAPAAATRPAPPAALPATRPQGLAPPTTPAPQATGASLQGAAR